MQALVSGEGTIVI